MSGDGPTLLSHQQTLYKLESYELSKFSVDIHYFKDFCDDETTLFKMAHEISRDLTVFFIVDSLAPGKWSSNLKNGHFMLILQIDISSYSWQIALMWIP